MSYQIDHVVFWVADPVKAAAFYQHVVGLEPLRVKEYAVGEAPFVSVRVGPGSIVDLMPKTIASKVSASHQAEGSAGNPVNHLCLAMSEAQFEALHERLIAGGHHVVPGPSDSFGAAGHAPRTYYFTDPDGNVLEARYYAARE